MIQKRIILIILFIIGLLGSLSFVSLLLYFDPYTDTVLALILLSTSFMFAVTSFMAFLLYFFKKIYYRGDVGLFHIYSSLRQSFLFGVLCLGTVGILTIGIPYLLPVLLLLCLMIFIELFIQSL